MKKSPQIELSNDAALNKKFGIVRALWNDDITKRLYNGVYHTLLKHGAKKEDIETLEVPGSFELIYGAKKMFKHFESDAIIVIGSIIKGETPHFHFISQSISDGVKDLNILFDIPFIFCVLTDLTHQQAIERSGGKTDSIIDKNKGVDSALTAIQLIKN